MNRFILPFVAGLLFIALINIRSQEQKQKTAQVDILNAESMEAPSPGMPSDVVRLIGNVELRHEGVMMYCDSAHRHTDSNIIHAFSNVHINQGDTLHLSGEHIIYYGNRRYAEVRRNVRLMDKETTLTTEFLDFDLENDYGYYPNGAVVINGDNRLESVVGYYYTDEKLFFFKDSVHITNPDYIIKSDTLRYNTVTEVAYFLGPTTITGDETNIYCENGWYNTVTDIAQFNENARVSNNDQILMADSLYYDNGKGTGEAFLNVEVTDTVENIIINGNYAWFIREPEQMFVTDKALLIQMSENDTLYLHADTLRSWVQINGLDPEITDRPDQPDETAIPDSTGRPDETEPPGGNTEQEIEEEDETRKELSPGETMERPGKESRGESIISQHPDTISLTDMTKIQTDTTEAPILAPVAKADSIRIMVAYYGVRYFSNEMQGKCDSLYYNMRDSIIYMYDNPVIWSDDSQLSSEYMEVHSKNGEIDRIIMTNSAFIVSEEEPGLYNQIKGKDILGYFRDDELYRVDVSGNAETLYYPEDNEEIIGISKVASSRLVIFLKESKPDNIRFLNQPQGTLFPMEDLPPDDRLLENFQWLNNIRPLSREDVFRKE